MRPGGVDDDGLRLPGGAEADETYDVVMNERTIWSIVPSRDCTEDRGTWYTRWPDELTRHLVGRADVRLVEHRTGDELARWPHVFAGRADRTLDVVGPGGQPLIVDKTGRMKQPMGTHDEELLDELVDTADRILRVLHERTGLPAFVAYGTLLGAVRDGRLIGHDNDIDLAYLSSRTHPADIVRESYSVERALRDAGFAIRRGSGARINVRVVLSDGSLRAFDVFTAAYINDVLYMQSDTGFALPRETILPLSTVRLLGRDLPAPARPEVLLAATYGEGWRTPDPSFQYETPRWLKRRLWGWYGGGASHRKYWDSFYLYDHHRVPERPTPFARWVARTHGSSRPLVDLGTGNGRDALWFADAHHREVLAVDYNLIVVARGNRAATARGLPVTFRTLTLYDARAVLGLGAALSRAAEPHDLYARFILHALDDVGQDLLIRLASMALRRDGYLFLEFRTEADRDRPHVFGQHFRNYLRPDDVRSRIEESGGTVVHTRKGTGLARLRHEDPHVCRMVACWSDVAAQRAASRTHAPGADR